MSVIEHSYAIKRRYG